jgi:hypothetical protein
MPVLPVLLFLISGFVQADRARAGLLHSLEQEPLSIAAIAEAA